MKTLMALTILILAQSTFAKVEAQFEELRDTHFQCEVVDVSEVKNGDKTKSLNPKDKTMTTLNQIGGADFTDAKCFKVPAISSTGEDVTMGFGCLPLDSKHVKEFSAEKLIIKRGEYNEKLEINFRTGEGSHSYAHRGCDWGRKCVRLAGNAKLKNCIAK